MALSERTSARTSAVTRSTVRAAVLEARADQRRDERRSLRRGDADEATSDEAVRSEIIRTRVLTETVLSPGKVAEKRWAGAPLNLWTRPGEDSRLVTVIPFRAALPVTGDHTKEWVELNWDGKSRWVNRDYVRQERPPKPEPEVVETETTSGSSASGSTGTVEEVGTSLAPCPVSSEIESGINSNAVAVYRSVCAAFPEVTSYGGYRADSIDHADGDSVDVMITGSTGDAIAAYLIENADALGIEYLMWEQQIWSSGQASSGWRYVEDRGSDTANHYDHVHVTTY